MSSDLSIPYARPIRFEQFALQTRDICSRLLGSVVIPELIEFSAPSLRSIRHRPEYLGPANDWLFLGLGDCGLFELGICPDGPRPEFRVELSAGLPIAGALAVSAAAALARLANSPVLDDGLRFTPHLELSAERFLEEVQRGHRARTLQKAAESLRRHPD